MNLEHKVRSQFTSKCDVFCMSFLLVVLCGLCWQ